MVFNVDLADLVVFWLKLATTVSTPSDLASKLSASACNSSKEVSDTVIEICVLKDCTDSFTLLNSYIIV